MKYLKCLFISLLCFGNQSAWSLQPGFKISAGKKTLEFITSGITWSNFCADNKMGCARFTLTEKNKKIFGFVKTITDQVTQENFTTYCMNSFLENKKIEKNSDKYTVDQKEILSSCSWSNGQDVTVIVLKEGLTVMVTGSDKSYAPALISMVKKARYHELP
jgi:hypothetical protein